MDHIGASDNSRLIRVQVKENDGSMRRVALRLSVSDVSTDGRLRVTLANDVIEDNSGEVTYYSSCLTEEDYRRFREEQGLLVEMSGFSAMIDRMVDMAEADETGSRFFTSLEVSGNGASLAFIEINAFKRLVHLRLKMAAGTDAAIRKHLAGQLRDLRSRLTDVAKQNDRARADLTDRNADVDSLHQQLEALRSSVQDKEASLASNLNREVALEKERSAAEISSARMAFNAERQRIIDENSTTLRRLQNQVCSLEYENKDLIERRHRNEASLLSLSEENKRQAAQIQQLSQEVDSKRAESDKAGEGAKALDQSVHRLQAQVSALEQENVRLSGQLSLKTELLKTTTDDKVKTEASLAEKSQLVAKRESAVRAVSQELVKANDTIKKLQTEVRRHNDKVKLSHKIVSEQEKLIVKKEAELEDTRTQLRDQSEANREWLASKDLMSRELDAKDAEIDQLRKTGKTSDTVIQWLNKQLTAAKVRDPGLKIGPPPSSLLGGAGGTALTPHSAAMPSLLGTPGGGAPAGPRGKSMVASTPLPPGGAAANSDEENHSANPPAALDPKYLQPANSAAAARKNLTKKSSKSTFSPKQTTPLATKVSKQPGHKTTFAESVYFS